MPPSRVDEKAERALKSAAPDQSDSQNLKVSAAPAQQVSDSGEISIVDQSLSKSASLALTEDPQPAATSLKKSSI